MSIKEIKSGSLYSKYFSSVSFNDCFVLCLSTVMTVHQMGPNELGKHSFVFGWTWIWWAQITLFMQIGTPWLSILGSWEKELNQNCKKHFLLFLERIWKWNTLFSFFFFAQVPTIALKYSKQGIKFLKTEMNKHSMYQ